MKLSVMVDTDVLIDVSRRRPEAITQWRWLERERQVMISDVVRMELMVGARDKRELGVILAFLDRYVRAPLSEAVSALAVELIQNYRLSHGLLIADAIIAASAIVSDAELATKNVRDFRYIDQLTLAEWKWS